MTVAVLAGGASSRFEPFNEKSKSLFTLMGKTILDRTIEGLPGMGVSEVAVVVSPDLSCELGNPELRIRKIEQPKPEGQADAILRVWKEVDRTRPIIVMNAQHFNAGSAISEMEGLYKRTGKSVILCSETDHPEKYGIVKVRGENVIQVVEKPARKDAPSNLRVVGIYLLTPKVMEIIKNLPASQYRLEDGLTKSGVAGEVLFIKTDQEMPSLKYAWDLLKIKDMLLEDRKFIDETAFVHKTALIEGPCWIGPRVVVGAYCVARGGVVLEEGAELERYVDAKNLIVGKNSHIHSGFVGDSVIGENCRIAAGFITANRRFDRAQPRVVIKGEKVVCGLDSLGVMAGDGVNIGIHCGTMPGTVIWPGSTVMPGMVVRGTARGWVSGSNKGV